jgi:hypothetical protein
LLVDKETLPQFEPGVAVVLVAEVLAAHPQYVRDCRIDAPHSLPIKMYLAFRSHDTDHDREIPDSHIEILAEFLDGSQN